VSFLDDITHASATPELDKELDKLNQRLDEVLSHESLDEVRLQKIINKRADLVESLLNNLNEKQKRCFAAEELKANDAILALVETHRRQAKADLKAVSQSSKAIKRYHQV
jgi:hypothetical protein